MIDLVIARLKAEVPELYGRVQGAGSFAAMIERNALPPVTPAAHVVPQEMRGGSVNAATGAFTQMITESIGVILTLRHSDQVGADGLEPIDVLKTAVISALAGWAPDDEIGVFAFAAGRLLGVRSGALSYEVLFSITDQLRTNHA